MADTEWVEEGDHEMDDELEEVMDQALVQVREQERARGDVGDELVVVVVEGNVQAVGNGHIHQADSSRMEGDHSSRIGSEEVEVRTWQTDQVAGCGNGVKGVAVAVAQCARTNNFHDGRIEHDQRVVGSGMSG